MNRRGPDECWPWLGTRQPNGYGMIWRDGKYELAHRVAYELAHGPIPSGLTIDHVRTRGCAHRDCCNAAHMEPVTMRVNVLRGLGLSAENARKTHCLRGHPFDRTDSHQRRCRQCEALYRAARRAR